MRNIIFFMFITVTTIGKTVAQDLETEAKLLFIRAEELYNEGQFTDCLSKLKQAEINLNGANVKILFLKAHTLEKLTNESWSKYSGQLKDCIDEFYSKVDKSTYSTEKYMEFSSLSLRFKAKQKRYADEFLRLNENTDLEGFKGYMTEFAGTENLNKLKSKYTPLLEEDAKKKAVAERRNKISEIDALYGKKIRKNRNAFIGMASSGVILFIMAGAFISTDNVDTSGDNPLPGLGYVFLLPTGGALTAGSFIPMGYWISASGKRKKAINGLALDVPRFNCINNSVNWGVSYKF